MSNSNTHWTTKCCWMITALILVLGTVLLFSPARVNPRISKILPCRRHLDEICVGLINYSAIHGSYPPAYLVDEDGRPAHSWRVLILPYIGQEELYKKYRFDEPWNGPHNRLLADEIPEIYRCPNDASDGPFTSYVAVVGPKTVWPGERMIRPEDVRDGTANTIYIAEMSDSGIPWMEPRDLRFSEMTFTINDSSGNGLRSEHSGGIFIACGDGSVRFLSDTIRVDTLRALLTRAGQERLQDDDW